MIPSLESSRDSTLVSGGWGRRDNTDQGSQFTSIDFVRVLKDAEIAISMDGKGSEGQRDNVFVERLWRTIKYRSTCMPTPACRRPGRPMPGI